MKKARNAMARRSREASSKAISECRVTIRKDWYTEIWCAAIATVSVGQSDTPVAENGQPSGILPSAAPIIIGKLKKMTARNDVSTSEATIFLNTRGILIDDRALTILPD